MIQLIPGHGWPDVVGILTLILAAFGAYFAGLVAVTGRVNVSGKSQPSDTT
jgi:hypothetical protein